MARNPLFPSEEEIDEIILGPESLMWQRFSDVRLFFASGYALLLQVAHPTVGSGVRDHSDFAERPWDRLLRTVDYLNLIVYAGQEAAAVGRRLRDMHKAIRGQNPDGSKYSALEPEAYAWVHATLIDGAIRAHERFVGPLSPREIDQLYGEYLPLGRLLGVRDGDLPTTWQGHLEYVDTMIAERLGDNETVQKVIRTMRHPGEAPPGVPIGAIWPLLRIPPSRALRIATFGLLPPVLRERFGVGWSSLNQVELRALGAASRRIGPLMPASLKHSGPAYLSWRWKEIAAGPLGPGAGSHAAPPVAQAA
jgi:uncharacterized protein (DUF2236 family)